MSQKISLKEAERKAFQTRYNDGLWDIFLGCFLLMFAVAPFLSSSLGDFWSTAVFVPVWVIAFLVIWLVRKRVVTPRVGVVRFGHTRQTRLLRFTIAMLVINVVAFVGGLVAALNFARVPGQLGGIVFGLILLAFFSVAAYFLDFGRLYIYGLLVGLAPAVGEWLWARGYATHHGYPITFGVTAGIMILVGVALFVRLLRENPLQPEGMPPEEAGDA